MPASPLSEVAVALQNLSLRLPPAPWQQIAHHPVGSLEAVGYAEEEDLLLAVSSNGRGVFDCLSGQRVARDASSDWQSWHDPPRLTAFGIGPLEEKLVRLAGSYGGG